MPKKTRLADTVKPQSAQVDAIRRLLNSNKFEEARVRLASLRRSFPGYRPLLGLAWEIEDAAGMQWSAVARALDWAEAAPGSETALKALAEAAIASDFLALGLASSIELAALRGETAKPMPTMETPFGPMTGEESVLVDISRVLLMDGRYDELINRLKHASNSALRNNLAIARFAKGDIDEALSEFEANWQHQPLNLFALDRMVWLRLWRYGRDRAAGLAVPLKTGLAQRAEDALGKLNGLILLDEWDAAEASWQANATAAFWDTSLNSTMHEMFDYAGAVVALRAGDTSTARNRLQTARQANPSQATQALDQALRAGLALEGVTVEIADTFTWFPRSWFQGLIEMHRAGRTEIERRLAGHLATCDAHADYLRLAVEFGGTNGSPIALAILQQRAKRGDLPAKGQLIFLLTRPYGPDSQRVELLNWLVREKLIATGTGVPMLAHGTIKSIKPMSFRLTPEPIRDNPYPPDVQELYEQLLDALAVHQLNEALALAKEICRQQPEVPMSHGNLAQVMEALKHPSEAIEAEFRRALELDNDYTFARAGLTRVFCRRGDVKAAKAMMEPALSREEYHFAEWRTILLAQRELAFVQGDMAAVQSTDKSLHDLAEMSKE